MLRRLSAALFLFLCVAFFVAYPVKAASTCATKQQGDANCDGKVDLVDYFYFVQEVNRVQVPPDVSADFNQDGKTDGVDRDIVVAKVSVLAQSAIGLSRRILATLSKFHI